MGILMQNVRKIKHFKSLVIISEKKIQIKLSKIVMTVPLPT